MRIAGLDHVQLSMEPGGEDRARQFYGGVLGLTEVDKPPALSSRGGCWFVGEGLHLHLGVEPGLRPSPRSHIAVLVGDLEAARVQLQAAGVDVTDDDSQLDVGRFYIRDPFGNRIELVAARDAGFTTRYAATVAAGAGLFTSAAADQYDRFVGRYSRELARALIAAVGVRPGQRALDVGCGPGALASELAALLGSSDVSAVDPSPSFVEACRARLPDVDVRVSSAEQLPFGDGEFDTALAQLVVNFMSDARAGVREMVRVTRPGGTVAAAVWDYGAGMTMLRRFWDAAVETDPRGLDADEAAMRYSTPDELTDLFSGAGLTAVRVTSASPTADYESFDELWGPFEAGIGPAGAYVQRLAPDLRPRLKDAYRRRLGVGEGPFRLTARAWIAVGVTA